MKELLIYDATGRQMMDMPYDEAVDILNHYHGFNGIRLGLGYRPNEADAGPPPPATIGGPPRPEPPPLPTMGG